MTNRFEPFNKEFFNDSLSLIRWFDKKGVLSLDEKRNAEITLITNGIHEQYTGYLVEIKHKFNGKLTEHYFPFHSYLKERKDSRQAGSEYPFESNFYVRYDNNKKIVSWYICIPTDKEIRKMVAEIDAFIAFYK